MNEGRQIRFVAERQAELVAAPGPAEPLAVDAVHGCSLVSLVSAGTELNVYRGVYDRDPQVGWGKLPADPGYATVIEITACGTAVTEFTVGDRALIMGPHRSWHRAAPRDLVRVPTGLDPAIACLARIAGITMSSLVRCAARPGQLVLITGLGPVGLLAALIFERCGYAVVAADPIAERRAVAERLGLQRVVERVSQETLGPAAPQLAIDCSAHEAAVLDAAAVLARGGELILVGVPMVPRTERLAQELLNRVFRGWLHLHSGNEWQIPVGDEATPATMRGNQALALRWFAEGSIDPAPILGRRSPADCAAVYRELDEGTAASLAVAFVWSLLERDPQRREALGTASA